MFLWKKRSLEKKVGKGQINGKEIHTVENQIHKKKHIEKKEPVYSSISLNKIVAITTAITSYIIIEQSTQIKQESQLNAWREQVRYDPVKIRQLWNPRTRKENFSKRAYFF